MSAEPTGAGASAVPVAAAAALTAALTAAGATAVPFSLNDGAQVDAMLGLHQTVFQSAVDRAWFDWKYRSGQGCGTGLWHQGQMVAYCGGVPRVMWHRGLAVPALQVGDVMVHPHWRGVLSRRGPFQRVSSAFYERVLGSNNPYALGFGFPSHRHLAVAQRLNVLRDAGPVWSLQWAAVEPGQDGGDSGVAGGWGGLDGAQGPFTPGGPGAFDRRWRVVPLGEDSIADPNPEAAAGSKGQSLATSSPPSPAPSPGPSPDLALLLDAAWQSMHNHGSAWAIGDRSARWMRWRTLDRPRRPVQWAAVFEGPQDRLDALLGLVLLDVQAHRPPLWLDWVGPPQAVAIGLRAAQWVAARSGHSSLQAWMSPAVKFQLESDASLAAPLGVAEVARLGVPCASSWPEGDPAELPWWFMGADTDFL